MAREPGGIPLSGVYSIMFVCSMYVCMYVCMHVYMYVCIFIKLHISAQSGPAVIRVILCHSHLSSQGGINDDTCYENL